MNILTISESSGSAYIQQLRQLLENEWGEFAVFETEHAGVKTPSPIVALDGNILAGGLVFSLWSKTEEELKSIWINGVIVKPNYRRQGVATKLIQSAMAAQPLLYALADLPALYTNIGWQVVSESSNGTVLVYRA